MRFITPYHKGARLQRGGQAYHQRGAGFGSVLKSIFSSVAPVIMKGIRALTSMGSKAAQHPDVKAAMRDIQSKAISEGVKYVNRVLTPKEANAQKQAIKRKVERQIGGPAKRKKTAAKKKKKKTKKVVKKKAKKRARTAVKKKRKKQVGRGGGAIF